VLYAVCWSGVCYGGVAYVIVRRGWSWWWLAAAFALSGMVSVECQVESERNKEMAKTAVAIVKPVAKRAVPNMEGVPGVLVSLDGLEIDFLRRGGRVSPYDGLLDQLASAPANSGLLFMDGVRAKASLYIRGKKKGLILAFAEAAGNLYVKLLGRVDDKEKETRRGKIKEILRLGAMSPVRISNKLREAGDGAVDAQLVAVILLQMQKDGSVIRQDGGDWRLAPGGK
jgi:hypothetical protein